MLRAGKTYREICRTLMMRSDHLRDEIYEIRKYEAIMGKGKNLTQEQKATIVAMKDAGVSNKEISQQIGCSLESVYTVLRAAKAREQYHEKKTGINLEFDAAVNDMIAESKSADAEKKSAIAEMEQEQVSEPAVIPDEVLTAVRDAIDYEEEMAEDHLRTIRELQHEIEQRRTKATAMRKWLEECGYESTED
jgi:IS30 family transposase